MNRITKILVVALGVSVLLNFAAAGYIGVRIIKDQVYRSLLHDTKVGASLPSEFKHEFERALRFDGLRLLAILRDVRAARDKQHSLLTAKTFDQEQFEAAQSEVRSAALRLIEHLQGTLKMAASETPSEIRRSIPRVNFGRDLLNTLDGLRKEEPDSAE